MVAVFYVVCFNDEETVAVVPGCWLCEHSCWWPPYKSGIAINKAVREREIPDYETWTKERCKVLYASDSYEKARKKLRKAEETSDLATDPSDAEKKRPRKRSRKRFSDSDSDADRNVLKPAHRSGIKSLPRYEPPGNQASTSGVRFITPNCLDKEPGPTKMVNSYSMSNACDRECCVRNMAFQERLLTLLEELREEIRQQKNTVQALVSLQNMPDISLQEPTGCPTLPADAPAELENLESFLANPDNLSKMAKYLSLIGGTNSGEVMRRLFSHLLTNELACSYNWKGMRGQKSPFCHFRNILKLILAAVRHHTAYSETSESDVEGHLKLWLQHATDRTAGRSKRRLSVQ